MLSRSATSSRAAAAHDAACCPGRHGDWNNKDVDFLNANPLITSKPVVYLVNLTEKAYATKKSKWLPKVCALQRTAQHTCTSHRTSQS